MNVDCAHAVGRALDRARARPRVIVVALVIWIRAGLEVVRRAPRCRRRSTCAAPSSMPHRAPQRARAGAAAQRRRLSASQVRLSGALEALAVTRRAAGEARSPLRWYQAAAAVTRVAVADLGDELHAAARRRRGCRAAVREVERLLESRGWARASTRRRARARARQRVLDVLAATRRRRAISAPRARWRSPRARCATPRTARRSWPTPAAGFEPRRSRARRRPRRRSAACTAVADDAEAHVVIDVGGGSTELPRRPGRPCRGRAPSTPAACG